MKSLLRPLIRLIPVLLFAGTVASAGDLASKINDLLTGPEASRLGFWGIQIGDLETNEILFEHNPNRHFVPASNTKLFTTALALARLGPDYRFVTRIVSEVPLTADGRLPGDLILAGGGDPNLSARTIPYKKGPIDGNPLEALEDLAGQLVARGLRRVEGNVVGDDTAYVWAPYPEGWTVDDAIWEYGAPVSALTLHDNALSLTIRPGESAGAPAQLLLLPSIPFYRFDNWIRTVDSSSRRIRIDREPGSREVRLWGVIPLRDRGQSELLGISDPALYAAEALRDVLARRGVSVYGEAKARHAYPYQFEDLEQGAAPKPEPKWHELARRVSAPLVEDLRITNKVSQNLHAELALRAVARQVRQVGSAEAGLAEMKAFLDEIGIDPAQYHFADGSGLSRLNLVTPAAIVALLKYMYLSGQRENWISLMPIGGEDGTLSSRLQASAAAGRVHAKTGTLTHVSALSGYAERPDGRRRVFSILVNNYNSPSAEVRAQIDKICNYLME